MYAHLSKKPEPAAAVPQAPADLLDRCRQMNEQLLQADLDTLRREHDALVRELYHLTKFVTLTSYDPAVAEQDSSEVFAQFQAHYDLATKLAESAPVARVTRRAVSAQRRSLGLSPGPSTSDASDASDTPRKRSRVDSRKRPPAPEPAPAPEDVALVPLVSARVSAARPPPLRLTSPAQRPLPPTVPGGSLAALFASYAMWDDEPLSRAAYEERVARNSQLYVRLDMLRRAGHALEPSNTLALLKAKPQDAPRGKAHWDHVLDGVMVRATRARQAYRARVQLAKKVSRMVAAYWDRAQNSGEREQKLELRRQRALAKWTMREVARQWKLAVTVIRGRKQAAERAEREKLGKKQLQVILEQSTQMLETQHAELAEEDASDAERFDEVDEAASEMDSVSADDAEALGDSGTDETGVLEASGVPEASDASDASDDEQLERKMWDEDEADEDEDEGLVADAELPLEELMKKYGYGARDAVDTTGEVPGEADVKGEYALGADEGDAESASEGASVDADEPTLHDLLGDATDAADTLPKLRTPFLLRGTLRSYQQKGVEWLISLYANQVNGILADEMGLGKTIQTIALLAHLACDRGVWGPHLIVAPTSVMLNWEMEFKKFLPGFKILSYYGSQKQRKAKRVGWNTPNSFNVCITSYQLVLADQHIFRRKPWVYLVLDEAHHIKNFRSQRWQTLLGFHSERRLLLTGTPLQNNLMDLWSLMYFLMPQGIEKVAASSGAFTNMKDFQDWFSNPLGRAAESVDDMDAETRATVAKLHTVLRPYVLRRLKSDVERELPKKYEHVLPCRLSKRQRFLYNDFMSRAKTRESLASGNYMSIINCLMQLRKVCNHPDLFEPRPIVTPFVTRAVAADFEIKDLLVRRRLLDTDPWRVVNLDFMQLRFADHDDQLTPLASRRYSTLAASDALERVAPPPGAPPPSDTTTLAGFHAALAHRRAVAAYEQAQHAAYVNRIRCAAQPVYGRGLLNVVRRVAPPRLLPTDAPTAPTLEPTQCDVLRAAALSYMQRADAVRSTLVRFAFATPAATAPDVVRLALGVDAPSVTTTPSVRTAADPLHDAAVALNVAFPDASLLQYDCGKLQQLDVLMRRLVAGGHRVLIFTQMTKVLDILEKFFNYHGYRYLRLDGATKVEQRQALTERFNRDARISAFILSTRSGGLGINLVGADTVIFYDLDWNAAIESQCMDRAHRIGQTRDVHIYRFVSEHTIEENMLRKANQKRRLDSMVIQQGEFTTEHLLRNDWRDMLDEGGTSLGGVQVGEHGDPAAHGDVERAFRAAEDAEDAAAVHVAQEETQLDHADFVGETEAQPAAPAAQAPSNARPPPLAPLPHEPTPEDESDDLVGSVDDYMLRMVESDWEFFGA